MSGRGTIWFFVVPHPPPLLPANAEFAPFNVIVVVLNEAPRCAWSATSWRRRRDRINEVDPPAIGTLGGACARCPPRVADKLALPRWVRD